MPDTVYGHWSTTIDVIRVSGSLIGRDNDDDRAGSADIKCVANKGSLFAIRFSNE